MFYCAFVLAVLASSIATFGLYAVVDHRHGLDFATMRLGCTISIIEATSGLLGMASLNHLNIPMFGKTSIETFDICVIASVLTVTAVFITHDQLMERITSC